MQNLIANITEILLLAFIIITFLQSGFDKIFDWKGNVSWLKEHFSKTFMANMVPFNVAIILILEMVAGVLCVLGTYQLVANDNKTLGLYGAILSCIVLLMLLFGQRVAKDYAGAMTITVYFMVTVFGVYIML